MLLKFHIKIHIVDFRIYLHQSKPIHHSKQLSCVVCGQSLNGSRLISAEISLSQYSEADNHEIMTLSVWFVIPIISRLALLRNLNSKPFMDSLQAELLTCHCLSYSSWMPLLSLSDRVAFLRRRSLISERCLLNAKNMVYNHHLRFRYKTCSDTAFQSCVNLSEHLSGI